LFRHQWPTYTGLEPMKKQNKNKRKHKFVGVKQPHAISGGMMLMFLEEEEAQKKKIEIEKRERIKNIIQKAKEKKIEEERRKLEKEKEEVEKK